MNTIKITILFAAVALFASCKSNSTGPSGGGGTPMSAAHPGSSFMFTMTQTDQSGNLLSTTHITDSVVAVGVSWAGRSNVIEGLQWDDQGNSQTGYYALLNNGDVDLYLGPLANGIVTQWLTLPYSSGGPVTTTIEDQTNSQGGVTARTVETATYQSGSDTTILVQGSSLQLKHVIGTYVIKQSVNGTVVSSNTLPPYDYYWAPSIGFGAGARFSNTDFFGNTTTGVEVLTGYTLR